MSTEDQLLLVEIIKQQTALSIAANTVVTNENNEIQPMSEKSMKVKREIESSNFDNDEKQTLAKMATIFLNEPVDVKITDDNDDDEEYLTVHLLTLLTCKESGEDRRSTDFHESTKILKVAIDIDELYCESIPNPSTDIIIWGGLVEGGHVEYCFSDDDIKEHLFTFATEDEIESFVAGLSDKAINFWFETILATAKICRRM